VVEINWIFKVFFAFIKFFLSQSTIDKQRLIDTPKGLREYLEVDQIIEEMEGTSSFKYDPYSIFGFEK
jgi:hypothetical protein